MNISRRLIDSVINIVVIFAIFAVSYFFGMYPYQWIESTLTTLLILGLGSVIETVVSLLFYSFVYSFNEWMEYNKKD